MGKGKGKQGKGKQGKGKGKGKQGKGGKGTSGKGGKKCPAVTEIIRKLEVRSKKDKCIFNNLGWVETNGSVAEEVIVNAVKSLPESVAVGMTVSALKTCARQKKAEWAERPKRQRCDSTYAIADKGRLDAKELQVTTMKCMKTVMANACRAFVSTPTAVAVPIPLPLPASNPEVIPISIPHPGTHPENIPIPISVNPELISGQSSEEGLSSNESSSSNEGSSSHEGSSSKEGSSSEEGSSSAEGGHSHGGWDSYEGGGGGPLVGPGGTGSSGFGSSGGSTVYEPFPILPAPYPLYPGKPENFQQVIVESPSFPAPYYPPPPPYYPPPPPSFSSQGLWPQNLIAALLPADWVADNLELSLGQLEDTYDEYEYGEYEYGEYEYGEYEYGENEYEQNEYGEYEYTEYEYDDAHNNGEETVVEEENVSIDVNEKPLQNTTGNADLVDTANSPSTESEATQEEEGA